MICRILLSIFGLTLSFWAGVIILTSHEVAGLPLVWGFVPLVTLVASLVGLARVK